MTMACLSGKGHGKNFRTTAGGMVGDGVLKTGFTPVTITVLLHGPMRG